MADLDADETAMHTYQTLFDAADDDRSNRISYDELIEAARVDGANQIRTFFTVAVPAARPAMAILGLFTFMMAWTDYLWPLIVLSPQNPTLQTALGQLQSGYYVDYSIVLAGAVLATLPLLILFIAAGRQLISGIMQGAVKG